MEPRGCIGWGGNSGFQAVNLALQFGAARIILLGYDYTTQGGIHFDGRHPPGMRNPSQAGLDRWGAVLDSQRPFLDALGVEVINCSPVSSLSAFRRLDIFEALALPSPEPPENQEPAPCPISLSKTATISSGTP